MAGKTLGAFLIGMFTLGALPFILRGYTALKFSESIYSLEEIPDRSAAIVLGAQVMRSGRMSAMLRDRVAAGVDLYHQGKVDVLLLSGGGDNTHRDETAAMLRYALENGVPESAILVDTEGIRTYESCRRAREIFELENVVVVTQEFHLDRALMLCRGIGLDAVGLAADYQRPWGYSPRSLRWSRWREIPATAAAFIDLLGWWSGQS